MGRVGQGRVGWGEVGQVGWGGAGGGYSEATLALRLITRAEVRKVGEG